MKLFLTSYRIPQPEQLLKLLGDPKEVRLGIIPNASDYYADRARSIKINESKDYMANLGLTSEVVDLKNFRDIGVLKQKMSCYNALWVTGGNTFCLRYEMRHSGFDQILPQFLSNGGVYIGESAGACVLNESLKGLELEDNPLYAEEVIWEGLGMLDKYILPHADNPWMKDSIDHARSLYDPLKTLELNDSDMYIVNDEKSEVIHETS